MKDKNLNFYTSIFKLSLFIFFLHYIQPIYSTPDLTVVGYVLPQDGLGKVPITIIETLDNRFSINFIHYRHFALNGVSDNMSKVLHNPDKSIGKVVLVTNLEPHPNREFFHRLGEEGAIRLAYFMLETTRIPDSLVNILNQEFEALVVPDEFLIPVCEHSGVQIPIFVLPIPMILETYFEHSVHPEFPSTPFTFIDASVNKNPAMLIEAFAKAFGNSSDVCLFLRAGDIQEGTRNIIHHLIAQYGLTNVRFESGHMPLNQWIERLLSSDCYVNLSRGEGFSFIPREALALGVPVIIPDNTALTTICKSHCVRPVPCKTRGPANPFYERHFGEDCGEQFDCNVEDVVEALLDVYNNYGKYIQRARQGRQWVEQYDIANRELQNRYQTLVKPRSVVFGNENVIKDDEIVTNSVNLFMKYQDLISREL